MIDLRTLLRPMIAAPFVIGAINSLKAVKPLADKSADVALPIAEVVGLPKDPETLVKINAGVQLGAAAMLTFGYAPRVAALILGGSLVPTTIAGHRFWTQKDPAERNAQLLQFSKNAGMLGGLLALALDTGGRPSVVWSSRRAIGNATHAVADSVASAVHALPGVS